MKKIKLLSLSLLLMMGMVSTGCMSTRDTVRLNQVELGMDKSDIQHLLGTPLFKNANQQGEKWGYRKYVGEITDSEEMYFIVRFDTKDRVIAYQSVTAPERNHQSHDLQSMRMARTLGGAHTRGRFFFVREHCRGFGSHKKEPSPVVRTLSVRDTQGR